MWVIILFKRAASLTIVFLLLFTNIIYAYDKPQISAVSAVSIDSFTNKILFEKNAFNRMPMASTTKIMTALIACESGNLNREITVSAEMLYKTEGTLIYLKAGDKITLLDLIKGALLASGNDAANVIAFAVSGSVSEFIKLMNNKAQSLSMTNTGFVTPSGLDAKGHYSCAYDMALLASAAMKNPVFKSIVKCKSDTIVINNKKTLIYNHNKLLSRDKGYIGVKTGFTKKSGRCLVSAYDYNGALIISVTLRAPDDWDDHLALVNYSKRLYNNNSDSGEVYINSAYDESRIKCKYEYSVYTVSGAYVKISYYPFIYLPHKSGDKVGTAKIYTNDVLIIESDIIIV